MKIGIEDFSMPPVNGETATEDILTNIDTMENVGNGEG